MLTGEGYCMMLEGAGFLVWNWVAGDRLKEGALGFA